MGLFGGQWISSLSLNKIWVNWGEKIRVWFGDFFIVENHCWQIDGKSYPNAFCWWQTVVEILFYKIILGQGSRSRSHFVGTNRCTPTIYLIKSLKWIMIMIMSRNVDVDVDILFLELLCCNYEMITTRKYELNKEVVQEI